MQERSGQKTRRVRAPDRDERSRQGLHGIFAVLLGLASLPVNPVPSDAQHDPIHAGPMLGFAGLRSVAIWVQTEDAAAVQLRYYPEGIPELAELTSVRIAEEAGDHTVDFRLSGLEPGTRYRYEIYVDGRLVLRPYALRFRTQPLWQWRDAPPDFSALIGSCAYVNDAPYDRPGRPYGSEFEIFEAMADEDAALMLWLGDNLYTRESDFFAPEGLAYRYRHDRALRELQPLLAAMHHYATWDDHDYGPNNSDRSYALKDASLKLFQRYWPGVRYGTPSTPGVFRKVSWSDVEIFLLDDRYYRMPQTWPEESERTMLGRAQLDWLKDGLLTSEATFKIVACGSQVLNPVTEDEGMVHYRSDLEAILQCLREGEVGGVVFISGDRHWSELIRVEPEGLYPLYDFTSSPLTAGVKKTDHDDVERDNPYRVPGTLVQAHSYGKLRVEGPEGERTLILQARNTEGEVLWEHTIPRTELEPAAD